MGVEIADVCTPALDTVCTPIELSRKSIKDVEQCYTVTRTVCTESTEEIDNEVCTYSYQPKTEATTAKTVEVSFNKECENMMVTVCQPNAGYGYHAYGHNYCKEVAQETCYNVPVLTVVEPAVDVIYPEPIETCVNKPISLPRISCEDLSEEKCITVPEIEVVSETFEKCVTGLTDPACQAVELTLPTLLLPLLTPLLLLLRLRPSTTSCKSAKQSRQDHVRNSRQTIACTPYLLRNLFNYLFGFEI